MMALELFGVGIAPGHHGGALGDTQIGLPRPGVQHELTARRAGIGGDEGSLHTEFVRRAGLAPADALYLRRVEGIQLPAALALLLRADLIGARERP